LNIPGTTIAHLSVEFVNQGLVVKPWFKVDLNTVITMSSGKVDSEPAPGVYAPRRSHRVSTNLAQSDGDVWQEKLAVCEGVTPTGEPRLIIRSFYRNTRTKDRVWDEPPSGAGTVLHATSEMRKAAEIQKEELQLTLEMIPPDEDNDNKINEKSKKEKKSIFGRFRKKKEHKQVSTSKDLNLQRAIARSMADQKFGSSDEPIVYYDGESSGMQGTADDDDEDIALAKALSMSEAGAQHDSVTLMEEEMFQRALAQSQTESQQSAVYGVASMPTALDDSSFSSFSTSSHPMRVVGKRDPNEDSDQKIPAIPFGSDPAPPATKFDPYGK
jgi:hypothetical protein